MTDDQPYYTIGAMESLQERVIAKGMHFNNGYVATPARLRDLINDVHGLDEGAGDR
jgi:hypothetical protein